MSEKKPRVEITNRPSNNSSHSATEWAGHIETRERRDTRRDIVESRARLGKLSTRFVVEAMCAGEPDEQYLISQMLGLVDGDVLVEELEVDLRDLKKLAQTVGGERTKNVVENSVLREIHDEPKLTREQRVEGNKAVVSRDQQQVELLRALLKTMDPEVVKKALTGG